VGIGDCINIEVERVRRLRWEVKQLCTRPLDRQLTLPSTTMCIAAGWENEPNSTGITMQRSLNLASKAESPSLSHWGFAPYAAIALVVIVLLTLTFAALETFLSGDESLSAVEAAMATH
jgi:hypothetical protein